MKPKTPPAPVPDDAIRVLLIEEKAIDAYLTRRQLSDAPDASFVVEHSRSLESALRRIDRQTFDLVLLDPVMPGVKPDEAVEVVLEYASPAPVVILACREDHERARRYLQTGVQDYVTKGHLESSTLSRTLRHAIERQHRIAALNAARERAEHVANHDDLTGLPARPLFHDRLRQAIAHADRYGRAVAVMFMDLDGFKEVNDSLGHPTGDLLLKEVARRLRSSTRRIDTVARFGGDEFVVVAGDLDSPESAESLARSLLRRIARPYRVAGRTVRVTTSIGIALYPHHGRKGGVLVRKADQAMYLAKEQGRSTYRLHPAMEDAPAPPRRTVRRRPRQSRPRAAATRNLALWPFGNETG